SVLNDSVAWLSGSAGWTARTADRGKSWEWKQLEQYKDLDFRDIEILSPDVAILVSAGSPGIILKTIDGGNNWKEVYRNDSPDIFLDGMDFFDARNGIVFGDPINNQMVLLSTNDGGDNWTLISDRNKHAMLEGEAGFAASGTSIRTFGDNEVWVATGGNNSRIFYSSDRGMNWTTFPVPVSRFRNSAGIFSIAVNQSGN